MMDRGQASKPIYYFTENRMSGNVIDTLPDILRFQGLAADVHVNKPEESLQDLLSFRGLVYKTFPNKLARILRSIRFAEW